MAKKKENAAPQDWPESTEDRHLPVKLTDDERIAAGPALVDLLIEEDRVTAEKASMASQYAGKLKELAEKVAYQRNVVSSGMDRRAVPCHWRFECSGIDENGAGIHHPDYKTLFRSDTGEVVETIAITSDDRQRNLPLSEEETLATGIETLRMAGLEVREMSEDSVNPFGLFRIGENVEEQEIEGASSLAEAVKAALLIYEEVKPGPK